MDANWHYVRDGRSFGPFTLDQIRQLSSSGLLSPTDMVKPDAAGAWVSAGTIPGLTFPTAPPASVAADRTDDPPGDQPDQPPRPAEPPLAPKRDRRGKRSLFAMLVVWAAVAPLALVFVNQVVTNSGNRLPAAVLALGGLLAFGTWFYLGFRAVANGVLPTFSGRLRRRPFVHRVGGLVVLYAGLWLSVELVNEARNQSSAGPSGPNDVAPASIVAGYEKVSYEGGEEVLYRPGYRSQAEGVGRFLRECGYFDGAARKSVVLDRGSEGWSVKLVVTEQARNDPIVHALFRHSLGIRLAARVLSGEPVEFQFCDPELASHATVGVPGAGVAEIQGKDAVYFLGPLQAEAGRLATFLKPQLGSPGERAYILSRTDAAWSVAILNSVADSLRPQVALLNPSAVESL